MATKQISIHAPLAGSDVQYDDKKTAGADISIHAPLAGSDCVSLMRKS